MLNSLRQAGALSGSGSTRTPLKQPGKSNNSCAIEPPRSAIELAWTRASTGETGLRDGGDVAVVEVDRLVESAAEGGGVAGEDIVSRDLAAFDLGDPALGDAHAVGDLLLGQAAGAADLGEAVPEDFGEHLALAGLDRVLPARAGDVLGPDVGPGHVAAHRCCSSSSRRSLR